MTMNQASLFSWRMVNNLVETSTVDDSFVNFVVQNILSLELLERLTKTTIRVLLI